MANPTISTETTSKRRVYELDLGGLSAWCESQGFPKYRAEQIRRWIFGHRVDDFSAMHDIPAALRAALTAEFSLFPARVANHQVANDRTEKLLLELGDGQLIECVLMRETDRRTICISTQVGCAMGCVFCASGMLGLKRNLTTGEILEQILRLDRLLAKGEQITNVVVMGIGEPLANLKSLVPALDTLNEKGGLGIGARRITISTVGLPEKIRELAKLGKQYNLAVSLHAPNDELRNRLVPVNDKIGIDAILAAADEYFEITGRRVTYEYVLLSGVNDEPFHARQLAKRLQSRIAHVNLIPMNGVTELEFVAPTAPRTDEFVQVLESFGIPATVRKRKGADIDAACGQLRLAKEREKTPS
ncbi:23S rRNA (adenine(2503)-C(2))-methyltransferase RlmN [Schlesneria paludicola]|uniref:23S rRNA (adenine(2503)-C(2))-methyltransferase RlmN n=1 Tax=Schlesneria paludicola TaxID=360056 RepID=UPI000299D321|nr:23S rRNA (adenine(2503)-C(2))-methyltransferase RlmN [Schlesneria paludicola]